GWAPFVVFSPGSSPLDDLALATARATTGVSAATLQRELADDPASFALTAAQAATAAGGPPSADRRLLVVVDQFERIFTQCTDPLRRQRFVTALHTAATTPDTETGAPAALVLVVVRADFEARCAELDGLADTIRHRCLLTSMTERQLRLAITKPAEHADSRVEDELTEHLLREVRAASRTSVDAPGGLVAVSGAGVLPLVSDALDRAWRNRSSDTLTLADYERVGGIERVVASAADTVYNELSPERQLVARRVFTGLTFVGPDGADTAGRVRRSELTTVADPADVEAVLEAFAAQRLLTLGDDSVEISHEVLLGTWPLLRDEWLADTRADRAVRTRLHTAAVAWDDHGGDNSYLYTGSVLETATTTSSASTDLRQHTPLSDLEHRFLTASIRADRRRTLQRRAFTATLLLLVIVLTTVATAAVRQTQKTDDQRRSAVARDLISRSQLLAESDPAASRLTALAAWRIHNSDEAGHAMRAAALNPFLTQITPNNAAIVSTAFHPTRDILATRTNEGRVELWNPTTGTKLRDLPTTGYINSMIFHPTRDILATSSGSRVQLWNTTAYRTIDNFPGSADTWMAFTEDGDTFITGRLANPAQARDIRAATDDATAAAILCTWQRQTSAPDQWTKDVPSDLTPQLCN
ncbi:WD40 repeat domain-containing protein, partial [Nocardia noduli]|uniref:WD40 repeat domain-containing protein n=1 Tax=Nocardia noduli TaxID=2815722 RepID=UPI0034D50E52